jgi:prepilin-type N-terminal cleavage/methylation domain-containing protein
MKNNKGFNLVELLAVMFIFSLIFAFSLATVRHFQREALLARANGDLTVLQTALDAFQEKHGSLPEDQDLHLSLKKALPKLIDQPLTDPFSDYGDAPYQYRRSPNGIYYLLYSLGPAGDAVGSVLNNGQVLFSRGKPSPLLWRSNQP